MADTHTPNYNLLIVDENSFYTEQSQNDNMQIIDGALKSHSNSIADHEERVDVLEQEIDNIQNPIVIGNVTLQFGNPGQNLPVNINVGFKPRLFYLVYNTDSTPHRAWYMANEPPETNPSMNFTDTGVNFNITNYSSGAFTMKITYACYR